MTAPPSGSRNPVVRRARPEEAARITRLALRSKASNGYDAAFMAACVAELTMTADRIRDGEVWVVEAVGAVVGYFELRIEEDVAEVLGLFVEPAAQRSGIGRMIWAKLVERARDMGARSIGVGADPAARGFYEEMGCTVVGEEPSGSVPGRVLPRLELPLAS